MQTLISPLLLRAGLRYQARHPWQLLLALVGISMGVAVVLAVDLANDAAKASFRLSAAQISGNATHRIVGTAGRVPDRIYRDLFTEPQAPAMAPVIEVKVRAQNQDTKLRLLGLDIFAEGAFRDQLTSVVSETTTLADWLSDPQAAAISRAAAARLGVGLNDRFEIQFEGRPYTLRVAVMTDDDSLTSRDLVVVDIATAKALTGWPDEASHIDLTLTAEEADRIANRLDPGVRLVTVDDQLDDTAGLSSAFELNLTAMSLLALLVGLFLIFNAISFSIVQRRRLLGRLRALGVTRREIGRLVLLEAIVIAIVGTLIGTALGAWLAQGLTQIVAATISALYYDVAAGALTWQPLTLIKAWTLGIGGTLLAAWLPARQAAHTPPLTTLSRAALETSVRRQLPLIASLGGVLLGVGLWVALSLPGGLVTGFVGLFMVLVGAAMLTPFTLHLAHGLLRRLPVKGIVRMAIRDIDRHLSRLGTAAAALMVALAASVGVAVMVESMRGAVSDWLDALLTADLYVAADAFVDNAPLPDGVLEQLVSVPAVASHSSYRDRNLQIDGRRVRLVAVDLAPQSRIGFEFVDRTDVDPWAGFDSGGVIVSEPLSHRLGIGAGDVLSLDTPGGPRAFSVSGVYRDFASEHGRLFVDRGHYRQIWADDVVDTVALFARPGLDTADLLDAVTAHLADRDDLAFTAAREIYAESMRIFERTFRITDVLRWLSILVAFIGVFSALMALQLERRKEYAVLRALGLTRSQVSGLIVIESLTLGAVAAVLAMPVGLAMAWVLTAAVQLRAFGWTMPLSFALEPYVVAALTGTCAALLASLLPAWRSAGQNPAPQLRED